MKVLENIVNSLVNWVIDNLFIFLGVMAGLTLIIIVCWRG